MRKLIVSFRTKVEKKLERKEKSYETKHLMKDKRSDRYKVLEEVLDRSTLITIYNFERKGIITEIHGAVKSGKEAKIYWGRGQKGREIAIKIYLTVSSEFKQGMLVYIKGDPRFAHVRRDTRSLIYAWAQKEFKNLQRAYRIGITVPKPIAVDNNVLIMEFIGENGVSAPLIKETSQKNPRKTYLQLLSHLKKLYQKAELVHADLSEYNIMIWNEKPVVFDFSQAVLIQHPMANTFLRRDLKNINRYFKKLGVDVQSEEEMYRRVTGGKS